MTSTTSILEQAGLGALADDTQPPSTNVVMFGKPPAVEPASSQTPDEPVDDFELFLIELKTDIEQSFFLCLIQDVHNLLARIKVA